jgi:Na+-transporting methylmalonyl-CoA/oxaloacetate decarboxylase gamma subunit
MDFLGNELISLKVLAPTLVLIFLIVLIFMVKALLREFADILKDHSQKMKKSPIKIVREDDLSLKIAKERENLKNLRRKIEGED